MGRASGALVYVYASTISRKGIKAAAKKKVKRGGVFLLGRASGALVCW